MPSGHLLEVLLPHTFHTCIGRMGSQGEIGLGQPVAQGLGMNPKHASTRCYRKKRHNQDAFLKKEPTGKQDKPRSRKCPGSSRGPGHFWEVRRTDPMVTRQGKGRKRGLACFEAAFGMEIAGTTLVTTPPPRPGEHQGRGRAKRARSAVQADDAPRESSGIVHDVEQKGETRRSWEEKGSHRRLRSWLSGRQEPLRRG
jgi:hypothetical protein